MRLFMLVMSTTAVLFTACSGEIKEKKTESLDIPVVRLQPKDTTIEQEYVADIQASKNVEIRAKIQGFIEDILVDEGQEVKKGQPLFTISSAESQTECSRAQASLANAGAEAKAAELELKRVKLLVDKNIISKSEYELAQAKLKSAEAKVAEAKSMEENARIRLSYSFIRSPFNGVIDRIPLKPGSLVSEGTLLTSISDLQKIYAYFSVSENEYLRYIRAKNNNSTSGYEDIKLILADGSPFHHPGKIETMESEFDSHTGSIAFRATFPNPDKLLKHGASGKILLTTPLTGAIIIPQKSVMEIQDKNFVFVVAENNTVKMKSFSPKVKINESIIVQSGLSENETIVYEGIQNIREGASIKPKYMNADGITEISYSR